MYVDIIKKHFNLNLHKCLDLLYPPVCPVCGKVLEKRKDEDLLACHNCCKKLVYIESPRCLKCGKPVGTEETEMCYDCERIGHIFTQGAGVWAYSREIKQSIYRFKYHNKREYGKFYGKEMMARLEQIVSGWNAEVLIPVPLHPSKLRKRGYNQAEIIALNFGREMGIPVNTTILRRNKKTLPQKELNDKERLKNLESAFIITTNDVKYKRIILVDDIYTTGTTIDSCAKALIDAGAEKIYYVSLCIGRGF